MKVLLLLLLLPLLSCTAKRQNSGDNLLTVLKDEISKKGIYDKEKDNRLKTLKQALVTISKDNFYAQYNLCDKIYDEYKDFKFDSAYVYAQKLLYISNLTRDLPKQYESRIKLGAIQLSGGMFKETFDCMRQMNVKFMPDSVKLNYYELKSRAFKDLAQYNTDQFYYPLNYSESLATLDSALALMKSGSYEKLKFSAQILELSGGQQGKAVDLLNKILLDTAFSNHQRAMAANDLSYLTGVTEKTRLITLAAIYDIRSSTKQTLAIYTLGNILFERGDVENAELLLREALDQVTFYGNKPREREITAILTRVAAQKLINSETRKNQLLIIMIAGVILVLMGTAFISFIVYTRLKKIRIREALVRDRNQELDRINKKLLEDAHIKEEYIGYFFDVISGYINTIEKIKRTTQRKLKAKNYEELLQIANEINIKEERDKLFYTFDTIFLKLFPNFITTFNSLLKPEDQVWPKANEVLNTSLRIFALMRLGIKDYQTIANILESALSTVYTYKNRIKSKALVPGDEFDQIIMEIKFVDITNTRLTEDTFDKITHHDDESRHLVS